jgi:hypothetical protein
MLPFSNALLTSWRQTFPAQIVCTATPHLLPVRAIQQRRREPGRSGDFTLIRAPPSLNSTTMAAKPTPFIVIRPCSIAALHPMVESSSSALVFPASVSGGPCQ